MKIWAKIKNLDQKFAWSFLGFLLGFIGIVFSVYTIYFYEENPILQFEILTNTNVLDVKEDIGKLDILFDSVSIKKEQKNLRIITIKISNIGNENLTLNLYDKKDPLGFKIENGEVLQKPVLLEASNDYLKRNLKITRIESSEYRFSSVILDKSQYFSLKILCLVNENVVPNVIPIGYISGNGVPGIKINFKESDKSKIGFFKELFYGNIFIHFLRFIIYWLIIIAITILTIVTYDSIRIKFRRRKRKRLINKFKEHHKLNIEKFPLKILEYYETYGEKSLFRIKKVISKVETLKIYIEYIGLLDHLDQFEEENLDEEDFNQLEEDSFKEKNVFNEIEPLIRLLVEDKILIVNTDSISITIRDGFEDSIDQFIYFIQVQ
ncbi:MAG: hypothetical protein R8P61_32280 [Bacteroidia bacterium]|nr:hypothetical protein [Bacteroidia bacterium]